MSSGCKQARTWIYNLTMNKLKTYVCFLNLQEFCKKQTYDYTWTIIVTLIIPTCDCPILVERKNGNSLIISSV